MVSNALATKASTSAIFVQMTVHRLRALRSIATASSVSVGCIAVAISPVIVIDNPHSGRQGIEGEADEIASQTLLVSVEYSCTSLG